MESFIQMVIFFSNGPGDPEPLHQAIQTAKKAIDFGKPVFGICLGHQVLALANGISTYKMHNGHRGINHPVKNLTLVKEKLLLKTTDLQLIKKKQRKTLQLK